GRDPLQRSAGETREWRVLERHLAALIAAGRLPFLGDRPCQTRRPHHQSPPAREPHRLAVQQDPVSLIRPLDRGGIPETLHPRPFIETSSSAGHPGSVPPAWTPQ